MIEPKNQLIKIEKQFENTIKLLLKDLEGELPTKLKHYLTYFLKACSEFHIILIELNQNFKKQDCINVSKALMECRTLMDAEARSIPRHLRSMNHPAALYAHNALDDMFEVENILVQLEM